jgi:small GTP-binding protein
MSQPNPHSFQKIDNLNKVIIEPLGEDYLQFDLSFKIIIIGDPGVGKSCISVKAIKDKFIEGYETTVGFDFFTYCIKMNGQIIQLKIWDTCGQEVYRALIHNFFRNTSLAILVYSIDNKESFKNLNFWLNDLKTQSNPDIKIILIGNKKDLNEKREVTLEQGEKFYKEKQFQLFVETSAKTGENIQEIFLESARILFNDFVDYNENSRKSSIMSYNHIEKTFDNGTPLPKPNKDTGKKSCCA